MEAVGLIETKGLVASIEAADAMVKEARVTLAQCERTGGGLCTVVIRGDIAACKAAVEAGETAARRVGQVVAAHVIPSPHKDVLTVFSIGSAGE